MGKDSRSAPAVMIGALFLANACGGVRSEPSPVTAAPAPDGKRNLPALQMSIQNVELGSFAIVASGAVSLSEHAILEARRSDGSWVGLAQIDGGAGYRLAQSCDEARVPAQGCRELKSGDVLLPVRWTGHDCPGQCATSCGASDYHGGVHRLVATTCGADPQRVAGPPFELPPRPAMLPRWNATFGISHGTVLRVARSNRDRSGEFLGRYDPAPESRRELSGATLRRLVELLRAQSGIDDTSVKRCLPGLLLAYELRGEAPTAGIPAPASTLVLDYGCASFHVRGLGPGVVSTSQFDARYDEFVALARESLPDDEAIRQLR